MSNTLKIVVLGDSVPWGQGLLDEHKYANQIAAELCQSPATDICMLGHSGAIIGAGFRSHHTTANREVPASEPTILDQVDQAPEPAEMDLVLLDGGVNDVNIRTILNPRTTSGSLRRDTNNACHRDMKTLLAKAANTFNKSSCQFVVTGYYPIFSPNSDLELFEDADSFAHRRGLYGLRFLPRRRETSVLVQVCALTMQFWKESNAALARALAETASLRNLGARMVFVPGPFTERNALYAEEPWPFGFDANREPEDEVTAQRAAACGLHYPGRFEGMERETCRYA